MKKLLLFFTLVLTCLLASESAHLPFKGFMKDLDDLAARTYLEHQEQASMANLNCSSCAADTEQTCTLRQMTRQCAVDELCLTLATISNTFSTGFTRGCFPSSLCTGDLTCNTANQSQTLLFCVSSCCNVSLCNAGVPPQPPMTTAPSTAASTAAPSTATSTAAPSTATSTAAPSTAVSTASSSTATPTTAVVCGGALTGVSGSFTSPSFPNNYPNNLNCIWTITVARGRRLVLRFMSFAVSAGDFLRISIGGNSLTLTQNSFRNIDDDEPSYYDEFVNEENGNFYDDNANDRRFYYYYDGRRKEDDDGPISFNRQLRQVIVQGSNRQISIQFSTNASGSAGGFSVTFSDEISRGGSSGESGGESSDEEE